MPASQGSISPILSNGTPTKSLKSSRENALRRSSNTSASSSPNRYSRMDMSILNRPEVDIVFQKPLDKSYECPVCCQVLRYPVQFEDCGHRCCSSCLPELMRVAPRCPIDQTHIDRNKVYVDKAYQREIDNLPIKCSHHDKGCPWKGVLKEIYTMILTCRVKWSRTPQFIGEVTAALPCDQPRITWALNDDLPQND